MGEDMRQIVMIAAGLAAMLAMPAAAQVLSADQVTGQPGAVQGTASDGKRIKIPVYSPVRADGTIIDDGAVPNGGSATGVNPTVVAGSDGTNVRTLQTGTNGAVVIGTAGSSATIAGGTLGANDGANASVQGLNVRSAGLVFNGATLDRQRSATSADATTGTGLLGAGILGQYQTTLPTYTAGQFGTLAMTSSGVLSASLAASNGAVIAVGQSGDAQGSQTALSVRSQPQMFNGTTWDRVRGDTTGGLWTQERERSQFFAEAPGILAASAFFNGVTRDGSVSPSQWGTFSCFISADQASAPAGFAILGSNDGTTFFAKVTATIAANTPTRITDRNDTRYSRCRYVNGATANTAAPVINSSFGQ